MKKLIAAIILASAVATGAAVFAGPAQACPVIHDMRKC